jgi:hypothetical protein
MQEISDYDAASHLKKVWLVRGLAVVATVGLLAALAPLVWVAVTTAAGIAALVGMAAAGFALFQALPLAMQKLENRVLHARKSEARTNPIEQLQNEVLRRAERLQSFQRALVIVGGQIESIGQLLVDRRHRDPTHVLDRQVRALHRLQQFHSVNLGRLNQAQTALDEFRFTVERKESEWRIALAIGEANEMLDPNATENLMQDLLTDTALRSVQERFNCVFAELDVQMSSLDGPARKFLDDHRLEGMGALRLPEHTP